MHDDGKLDICDEALIALEDQSELAEVHDDVEYSDESDEDKDESDKDKENVVVQPAMQSGFLKTDVYTFDKYPYLYLKSQEFLRIKEKGLIEIIEDPPVRRPIYCVSATTAFPYLYGCGEKSPTDFNDYKLGRRLLKQQTLFAHKRHGIFEWTYAEDDVHMMFEYARNVELQVHAAVGFYLTSHPDSAHQPIDNIISAFRDGFNEDGLLESHLPGLSTLMIQLPNSRERWTAERMGIQAISRDLSDPNVFLTCNLEPRSDIGVRRLIYQLEHGIEMPCDHPFDMDTANYTELMSKYAAHISIYLCRKVKIFMRAFLDICGVQDKETCTDWSKEANTGWSWGRVEFTETRGVQHWHYLVCLPGVLDTALLGRMIQNGRVVRQEMKFGNIRSGMEEKAWEMIEVGLLAGRYATLFADSISTASFYEDDEKHIVLPVEKYRNEYIKEYKMKNVNLKTNACMRRFDDKECDPNPNVEMAKVASISCLHHCIEKVCGGDVKGKGCRFDFPKKDLPFTVPAIMQINSTQMEARILLRRTCSRVPNLNNYFLMYWRANHDVTPLIDAGHKLRLEIFSHAELLLMLFLIDIIIS